MPSTTFTWLRSLLAAALLWAMFPAPLAQEDDAGRTHTIPLFMSASDPDNRQGFVRVINHTDRAGTVRIYGTDDAGVRRGPAVLAIGALQTKHFNSNDFEEGHAGKELSDGVGPGNGDWRLEMHADDLDIEPLAYIRTTSDGFLTSMHDVVAEAAIGHRVPIFNPASNVNQVSSLRLINPGDADVNVTIVGTDDSGVSGGEVSLVLSANGATSLTATDLEEGASNTDGELGDGTGKWSLSVSADGPIQVMSLMSTPTGHLSNLSAGKRDYTGAVGLWRVSFDEDGLDDGFIVLMPDSRMYAWLPESADLVRIARGTYRSGPAAVSGSGELYESGKVERVGLIDVEGGSDDFEFTADYRSGDWIRGEYTVTGGTARAFRGWATTGFGRGSSNLEVLGYWAVELGDDADLPGNFELDSDGNFEIMFEAAGITCTADGQLLPVNSAFNVYEAEPLVVCALLVFQRDEVELILAVMDSPGVPGGGDRAIVLVVLPGEEKVALGATFRLDS